MAHTVLPRDVLPRGESPVGVGRWVGMQQGEPRFAATAAHTLPLSTNKWGRLRRFMCTSRAGAPFFDRAWPKILFSPHSSLLSPFFGGFLRIIATEAFPSRHSNDPAWQECRSFRWWHGYRNFANVKLFRQKGDTAIYQIDKYQRVRDISSSLIAHSCLWGEGTYLSRTNDRRLGTDEELCQRSSTL